MATNYLKVVLIKEGLTQSSLAQATRLSAGTINKVACEKRTPSPRVQNALVKGLVKLSGKEYNLEDIFPDGKGNRRPK